MKIAVCVKIIKGDINPFDASALECALRLSDDVTVISMCPPSSKDALLALTRLGAQVILLSDAIYAGSDTLATSHILSSALSKIDYDLIICGSASPRAGQALISAAKVKALINGRFNVSFSDIEELALPVLRHRLKLNFEAVAERISADEVVTMIVEEVKKMPKSNFKESAIQAEAIKE
ncbi:MAG: hypothetical protein IKA57_02650 [Clostridia bacterium]|nr:hypothetical protein [Clostridia bacterium]